MAALVVVAGPATVFVLVPIPTFAARNGDIVDKVPSIVVRYEASIVATPKHLSLSRWIYVAQQP